jgi:hypothetical protein
MRSSNRLNSRLREECLNEQVFRSLDDARRKDRAVAQSVQSRAAAFESRLPGARGVRSIAQSLEERDRRAQRWAGESNAVRRLHCATVAVEKPDSFSPQPRVG